MFLTHMRTICKQLFKIFFEDLNSVHEAEISIFFRRNLCAVAILCQILAKWRWFFFMAMIFRMRASIWSIASKNEHQNNLLRTKFNVKKQNERNDSGIKALIQVAKLFIIESLCTRIKSRLMSKRHARNTPLAHESNAPIYRFVRNSIEHRQLAQSVFVIFFFLFN